MEQVVASEKPKERLYDDFHTRRNHIWESGEALFVNITCKEIILDCLLCYIIEMLGFYIKLSIYVLLIEIIKVFFNIKKEFKTHLSLIFLNFM